MKLKHLQSIFLPGKNASDEKSKRKMVIALHGLGDSAEGYRFLPDFFNRFDFDYLLLNAPDSYYMGYSWFEIPGNTVPGILRSRDLISKTIEELISFGYRTENILVLGFSQGGLLTMDLALRSPHKFAGFIPISGFVAFLEEYPAKFSSIAKEQKIFATHGDRDPIVPLSLTKPQMEALQGMGLNIKWVEYHKEHTIDPGEERKDLQYFVKSCLG